MVTLSKKLGIYKVISEWIPSYFDNIMARFTVNYRMNSGFLMIEACNAKMALSVMPTVVAGKRHTVKGGLGEN